jgi:hypothetical protein
MDWAKPPGQDLWRAIDAYLAVAYGGAPLPSAIRARLETLRAATVTSDDALYNSPTFERDHKVHPPPKLGVRLGNRFYPHMKLVVERSPDGAGYLFRADTHDQHIRPAPGSREYDAFCKLMEDNQRLAEAIDARWEQLGLPTFRQFLRQDLARRVAANAST